MQSIMCATCHKEHAFPVPRFSPGQKVKLVSDDGFHHKDKVGQTTTILGIEEYLVEPCDEVEYETEFGFGLIREGRLEPV
jgi:hypothetical protein